MKKAAILLLCLWLIQTPMAYGQEAVSLESIEAAFIYRFLNFVEWKNESPHYICIPDDVVLRVTAQKSLNEKTINDKKIKVVDRNDNCSVLVSDHLQGVNTSSMLTIGPLEQGALFEFRVVNNRLKFAIDPKNIRKSKLRISSQLLKLAILNNG